MITPLRPPSPGLPGDEPQPQNACLPQQHAGPLASPPRGQRSPFPAALPSNANRQCIVSCQAHSEEISRERNERQRLERDLDEASRRLAMAHQDIRRLTNELDAAKNNNLEASGMIQICISQRAVCSYLSI